MRHVKVKLGMKVPLSMSNTQRDELITFAESCTERIDRVVSRTPRWSIALSWTGKCFVAIAIAVSTPGQPIEVRGTGREPVFAIWDALSSMEESLRKK
jgi:hypothetical protein